MLWVKIEVTLTWHGDLEMSLISIEMGGPI